MKTNHNRNMAAENLQVISNFRCIITIDAMYLGGHKAVRPDLVPVRFQVGDQRVVVDVLGDDGRVVSWPSTSVSDLAVVPTSLLFGQEFRQVIRPVYRGHLAAYEDDGRDVCSAVSFLLLNAKDDGGGVTDARFAFPTKAIAGWFVRRSRQTLGLD